MERRRTEGKGEGEEEKEGLGACGEEWRGRNACGPEGRRESGRRGVKWGVALVGKKRLGMALREGGSQGWGSRIGEWV